MRLGTTPSLHQTPPFPAAIPNSATAESYRSSTRVEATGRGGAQSVGRVGGGLSKLRAAGQKNHYGTVPEGTEFSARAIEFISMLSSTVTDFQEELGVLANKCEIAHTELETIDDSNGREFQA